ncbi:hypothetical protein R1sor_003280 [Riccia sorocarpa]|uniref:Uncharacterized protein n=1 Tax=Riccia sorocarpa TaxID=122646 RepID=A0ABD3H1J5_9MARC
MEFINFCARAKKYQAALERGDADPLRDDDTRFRNFKHEGAEFAMKWQTYQEDVCHHQSHVPKLDYKLAIADVPYDFNFKGCRHEDKEPFSLQNFNDMISCFAAITESDYWTMVIFHSLQQANDASKALSDFGCSVVPGVWIKTNCKNAGGPRLVMNHEYFSVGFWSYERKMSMKHFGNLDFRRRHDVRPRDHEKVCRGSRKPLLTMKRRPERMDGNPTGGRKTKGTKSMLPYAEEGTGLYITYCYGYEASK